MIGLTPKLLSSSVGQFLQDYSESWPDEVVTFESVMADYESTAFNLALENMNPIMRFRNVSSCDNYELVTNVLGSEKRMAFALGVPVGQLYERWNALISNPGKEMIPDDNSSSPLKERIAKGGDVNLFDLPAPRHFVGDGSKQGFGQYITSGLYVARDPAGPGTINLSFGRTQILGKHKFAFDTGSKGHFSTYLDTARRLGMSKLPVSIVVGAHPIFYMLAASFIENEYAKAATVIEEEYTCGVTNRELPLSTQAELVIEGEVALHEHFDEGPFSEFTGYMVDATAGNVGYARSILRRNRPIYYDIVSSNSSEHVGLFSMPRNAAMIKSLKEFMPPGISYSLEWPVIAGHFLALCAVDDPPPGLAKQIGIALIGLDPFFTRIAIVSEGNSIPDLEQVLVDLAIDGGSHNIDVIGNMFSIQLDRSLMPEKTLGKMVIIARNHYNFSKSREP